MRGVTHAHQPGRKMVWLRQALVSVNAMVLQKGQRRGEALKNAPPPGKLKRLTFSIRGNLNTTIPSECQLRFCPGGRVGADESGERGGHIVAVLVDDALHEY